ncbi:MAG: hypothetical protein ACLFV7_09780, partial [Phycisphaerae bacterium]
YREMIYFIYVIIGIAVLFLASSLREYNRPFCGLHSWLKAHGPWFARSHVRYGLDYTLGLQTEAMGFPPPEDPHRYMDHPVLSVLEQAVWIWAFGEHEWVSRVSNAAWGVLNLFLFASVLRRLAGPKVALLSVLLWAIFPITVYFGTGRAIFAGFLLCLHWYLPRVGIGGEARRHWGQLLGLGITAVLMLQIAWQAYFYIFGIGVHYIGHCIHRRKWPDWPLVAVGAGASLLGAVVAFTVMLAGMDWDVQRIIDLYRWRSAEGEMAGKMDGFDWGAWLTRFWEFALTNFSRPILWLGIGGLGLHLVVSVWEYVVGRQGRDRQNKASHESGKDTDARKPRLFENSPHITLFAIPAAAQLLLLRGALWPHQQWEMPLAPVLGLVCGLTLWRVWQFVSARLDWFRGALLGAVLAGAVIYVGQFGTGYWPEQEGHFAVAVMVTVVSGLIAAGTWWLLRKNKGLRPGGIAVVLAVAALGYYCAQAANYYFGMRWQCAEKIAFWKDLNRIVPPDQALMVFDPYTDHIITEQSKAKGEAMRAEPAWYIDRRIESVPDKQWLRKLRERLIGLQIKAKQAEDRLMRAYELGRLSREQVEAQATTLREQINKAIQGISLVSYRQAIRQVEQAAAEGDDRYYLLPILPGVPEPLYRMLISELDRRYRLVLDAGPVAGVPDKYGNFYQGGMRHYRLYDLGGRQTTTAATRPR